jgi:hypothetical protein
MCLRRHSYIIQLGHFLFWKLCIFQDAVFIQHKYVLCELFWTRCKRIAPFELCNYALTPGIFSTYFADINSLLNDAKGAASSKGGFSHLESSTCATKKSDQPNMWRAEFANNCNCKF